MSTDVQRLIYHLFLKCFWNPDLAFDENAAINYDWYHPQLSSRHTLPEVESWFIDSGLTIAHRCVDPYGITVEDIAGDARPRLPRGAVSASRLQLLAGLSALFVTALVIVGAGYLASLANRSEGSRLVAATRVVVMLLLAMFVWLRPGVADLDRLPALIPVAIALFCLGWASVRTAHSRVMQMAAPIVQAAQRPSVILTALVVIAALPLAVRVAELFDVSGFMDSHGYDVYGLNIANGKQIAGNSQYMPAYQYGLAFVDYVGGHFFFLQQLLNLALACAAVAALSVAGWILCRSSVACVVVGLLVAYSRVLTYAVHTTQIEAWYVPATAAILLAWAFYWRRPTTVAAVWLGIALSVGINLRNQGAIFFAFMALSPLVVSGLARLHRLQQAVAIGAIVAASLVPWTVRNYVIEGRLSPTGSRTAAYLGVLNDRRVGLYGIRYWEGWNEVLAEFERQYPDPAAREQAFVSSMWRSVLSDPGWLARAIAWRTVAFYGLLPDGYLLIDSIVPVDWAIEWRRYLYWRTGPLLLLGLTALTLLLKANRTTCFLAGAIFANLIINVVSATSEDRLCYPVLLIHMLLVSSLFAKPASEPALSCHGVPSLGRGRLIAAIGGVVVLVVFCRVMIGSRYIYRPLMEPETFVNASLQLEGTPLDLQQIDPSTLTPAGPGPSVRLHGMVTNYMYPPKWVGPVGWIPRLATDPAGPQYFYLTALTANAEAIGNVSVRHHLPRRGDQRAAARRRCRRARRRRLARRQGVRPLAPGEARQEAAN